LITFHGTLSEESVYRRYFAPLELETRIRHERLTRMCFIDYDRQIAFVAEVPSNDESVGAIVGVGRLVKTPGEQQAELAVVVSDTFQKRGIGTRITERLLEFAHDEKLKIITVSVLAENQPMQRLLEEQGFVFGNRIEDGVRNGQLRI